MDEATMTDSISTLMTLLRNSPRSVCDTSWINRELGAIKELDLADRYLRLVDTGLTYTNPNSSSVAYVLGITDDEPTSPPVGLEITGTRNKMADIDLDVESVARHAIVEYLQSKMPAVIIGAWSELGTTTDDDGNETGSVLVTYKAYLKEVATREAEEICTRDGLPKYKAKDIAVDIMRDRYGKINTVDDIRRFSPTDHAAMQLLSQTSIFKSNGVHAAGVLLGTDEINIDTDIPNMLVASSDTTTTQYDMDVLDMLGLLKLDVLGQASLTAMKETCQYIGIDDPSDFRWIPDDDPDACALLSSGSTYNGVFHAESPHKSRGYKEMGVYNTYDACIGTAAYMPGCISSGQKDRLVKARKNATYRKQCLAEARALHPVVHDALVSTSGVMVFQDQPLNILRGLGMNGEDINLLLKVVKDSGKGAEERNRERMAGLRARFDEACEASGATAPDTIWNMVTGFMAYGFNQAHSVGYGIRTYRTAYLAVHHPLEFYTAMLRSSVGKKLHGMDRNELYEKAARKVGVKFEDAHVNTSLYTWNLNRETGAIVRGLSTIHGVGEAVAKAVAESSPYTSVTDLCERAKPGGKVISGARMFLKDGTYSGGVKALRDAGALRGLPD